MGFHSRSDETLLHFVLFAQNINCGSNSLAFFTPSLVNCEQPSKKSDIISVTTIFTRSTNITKPQLA